MRPGRGSSPPDNNFSGYDFWPAKLDQFSQPGEDVQGKSVALGRV